MRALRSLWDATVGNPTLRAAVDRVIPEDGWPDGWTGGVAQYLTPAPPIPGLVGALAELVSSLDRESRARGATDFSDLDISAQDAILRDLSVSEDGAAQVDLLLRVCWEGYYAARHVTRPAGLDMVGYHDVPPGVTPIEPPPLRTVSSLDLRAHYDAVVVGSGPGGGAAAWTLARAGRSVLVVERAANLGNAALRGDHLRGKRNGVYDVTVAPGVGHPRVFDGGVVVDGDGDSTSYGLNAMAVGGGTRVWQAMAWRFMPEDFAMATTYGVPEGSSLADWPISYEDLEPYYTQAEWELGVAGEEGGLTGRTPRTTGYPMPPMGSEPAREVLGRAAERLGWRWGPVPLAINSVARDGRAACVRCSQCVGHACPVDAKNGSHNTFLARALATGACDLLTGSQVIGVRDGPAGVVVTMVADTSAAPRRIDVPADVAVVSAGAIETPRLLLASGLGGDHVGRHLHDHRITMVGGRSERPVKSYRGPGHSIATLDHVHSADTPWGGGVIFDLHQPLPLSAAVLAPLWGAPRWGEGHKQWMRDARAHLLGAFGIGQEIPVATSRVTLASGVQDRWGMPAAQLHKDVHWTAAQIEDAMTTHAIAWLEAAGVTDIVRIGGRLGTVSAAGEHSCGTARMGRTAEDSATRGDGRVHGTSRVYACDSSLHPTNGSVNPTLTIVANALRVADLILDGWPARQWSDETAGLT